MQDERFDDDCDNLIKQAEKKGVKSFFCAATRPQDFQNVIDLAQKHNRIIPFIGTHPWFSDEYDPQFFIDFYQADPTFGGVCLFFPTKVVFLCEKFIICFRNC